MRLKNDKWYIGKTTNFNHRMDQHVEKKGAQWTKKHGPSEGCSELGTFSNATWEETKKTLEYMCDKGLNNVRGAEYCQIADFTEVDAVRISWAVAHHLGRDQESTLTKIIAGLNKQKDDVKKVNLKRGVGELDYKGNLNNSVFDELLERLKQLRKEIADEEGRPEYFVFNNETIEVMSKQKPICEQDFISLPGVGDKKLQKYGQRFLSCIKNFLGIQCRFCNRKIPDNPSKPLCLDCYRKKKVTADQHQFK